MYWRALISLLDGIDVHRTIVLVSHPSTTRRISQHQSTKNRFDRYVHQQETFSAWFLSHFSGMLILMMDYSVLSLLSSHTIRRSGQKTKPEFTMKCSKCISFNKIYHIPLLDYQHFKHPPALQQGPLDVQSIRRVEVKIQASATVNTGPLISTNNSYVFYFQLGSGLLSCRQWWVFFCLYWLCCEVLVHAVLPTLAFYTHI